MLKIFTKKELLNQPIIWSISSIFAKIKPKELNEKDKNFLLNIDKAYILDENLEIIITPFGSARTEDLSSGCKTLIVANHIINKDLTYDNTINLNNCGPNALYAFIVEFHDADLECLLTYSGELFKEKIPDEYRDVEVLINNEIVKLKDFNRHMIKCLN